MVKKSLLHDSFTSVERSILLPSCGFMPNKDPQLKGGAGHGPSIPGRTDDVSLKPAVFKPSAGRFRVSPVLFAFVLFPALILLSGCSNITNDNWTGRTTDDSAVALIGDYDLQHYVPIPAVGEKAGISYDFENKVEILVTWMDAEGTDISDSLKSFKKAVYKANITLKTKGGYSFDTDKAFSYPAGSVSVQPASTPGELVWELTGVVYKEPGDTDNSRRVTDFDSLVEYIKPRPNETDPKDSTPKKTLLPGGVTNHQEYLGTVEWVKVVGYEDRWNAMTFLYANPGYYFPKDAFAGVRDMLPTYINGNKMVLKTTFYNVTGDVVLGPPTDVNGGGNKGGASATGDFEKEL